MSTNGKIWGMRFRSRPISAPDKPAGPALYKTTNPLRFLVIL